jgi:hypothetical protein
MDTSTFDRIAKTFNARKSRRSAVKSGVFGAAGAVGLATLGRRSTAALEATPIGTLETGGSGEFLFVQTAASGSFRTNLDAGTAIAADGTPTPGGGASYLLTLEGHNGQTIYFSDRPERVFGQAPSRRFLDGLGFFPENPPNAAIVAQTDAGENMLVVELLDPSFDAEAGALTYGVNLLPGDQPIDGLTISESTQIDGTIAADFTNASLFIDDCPDTDIWCFKPNKFAICAPEGSVRVGTCWHWAVLACTLCRDSPDVVCESWSTCSDGSCIGRTVDEFKRQCGGGG